MRATVPTAEPETELPIPPYSFRSPHFSYSFRCPFCLNERAHTKAQHMRKVAAWTPEVCK